MLTSMVKNMFSGNSVAQLYEERKRLHNIRKFLAEHENEITDEERTAIMQVITAQEMIINSYKNMELLTNPSRAKTYR